LKFTVDLVYEYITLCVLYIDKQTIEAYDTCKTVTSLVFEYEKLVRNKVKYFFVNFET